MIATHPSNDEGDIYSYVYDAVLGLSLAFNATSEHDFNRNPQAALLNEMRSLSFNGLSVNKINSNSVYCDNWYSAFTE